MLVDIEDFNKVIKQIRANIDDKATQEELKSIVNDQALINESLCTENILARWAWRTGTSSFLLSMVPHYGFVSKQVNSTAEDLFLGICR